MELTAPYGHDGAFFSLRDFVNHYSESAAKLMAFTDAHLEDALRGSVLNNKTDILSTRDPLLTGVFFTPQVLDEVTEFMKALTDSVARNLQGGHPAGFRVGYRSMASWGEGERRAVRVRGGRSGTRPLTVHLSPV